MNSIKCKNCHLTNFSSEAECRRCGHSFLSSAKTKSERSPRSFSLSSLFLIALAGGLGYYFFSGTGSSMEQVNPNEAKRPAVQPTTQPAAGLSRTQYDQQRAGTYGDAVKNSTSLNAHQKHVDETQKTMQQISNAQPGK